MSAQPTAPPPIMFSVPEVTQSDIDAVVRILESGWLTTGRECAAFESDLMEYLGVGHVVATSSATTAEEIVLASLDLPPGTRVGLPNWTFVSTALAVHRVGAVPVLLDVSSKDLNLDPLALEREIDKGLGAVVTVHFAGKPTDAVVVEMCEQAGIPLVEDCAHSLGAADHRGLVGGKAGTYASFFSFYATKNLATGEGGAIATSNESLAEFAKTYRLHGMSASAVDRYRKPGMHDYDVRHAGLKANMPDILAALGRSQLARFDSNQAKRLDLMRQYAANLDEIDGVRLVTRPIPGVSAHHLCVVAFDDEDLRLEAVARLTDQNIGSSVHFRPIDSFSWAKEETEIGVAGVETCAAMRSKVLSLPLHPGLSCADVDVICSSVAGRRAAA